jgi:hypothetical protein
VYGKGQRKCTYSKMRTQMYGKRRTQVYGKPTGVW